MGYAERTGRFKALFTHLDNVFKLLRRSGVLAQAYGTHGGVSDREATSVQSLQTELVIVYFRGESYVHILKVTMFLDLCNVG